MNSYEHYLSSSENVARKKIQFPVGLLAQLVERCTGIAEVMHSISVYNRSKRIEDRFFIRISIIVIISIRFFHLFIYSFIFAHRVPSNLFQKLLLLVFEKRKKVV